MEKVILEPIQSEAFYRGAFAEPGFDLLADPVTLYRQLIKHLGTYGATLQSLKFDGTILADANVSCIIVSLDTLVRVGLDRLEVNFFKLHEVGEEIAYNILLGSWAAVKEADAPTRVLEHSVTINIHTKINGLSYDALIGRYVTIPQATGRKTHAGVAFYLPEDNATGERKGSVVLDRLAGQENGVMVKLAVAFEAKKVAFSALRQNITGYLNRHLSALGLVLPMESSRSSE